MKQIQLFVLMVGIGCALSFLSCTKPVEIKDGTILVTNISETGKNISIRFTRGSSFGFVKNFGPMHLMITPQIAIWVEDTMGNYLRTLYVTHKFGKQEWGPVPHNKKECFRTSSLPYWLNRYKRAGHPAPTTEKPLSDAITAATPTGSFDLQTKIPVSISDVKIFVEYNSSFDVNATYSSKRKESKINGQPAVVYSARLSDEIVSLYPALPMKPIGHSGETESDSALYPDISKMTTSLHVFDCINILTAPVFISTSQNGEPSSATEAKTGATTRMPQK
jgi:hypothetical protein